MNYPLFLLHYLACLDKCISSAHLDLGIFSYSSLQKHSKSIKLWGHSLCKTQLPPPPQLPNTHTQTQRFFVGFRSGLWLQHLKALNNYFAEAILLFKLDVCVGSLSSWKIKVLSLSVYYKIPEGSVPELPGTWSYSWFPLHGSWRQDICFC